MMQKILVTGVNGFVGKHVANELYKNKIIVIGVSNQDELEHDLIGVVHKYVACDLTNPESVRSLDLSNIDAIINLAGFAKVGESRGQGELYNRVNIGVHTILYDECLRQGVSPRIIAVSTGAVYDPNQQLPITELSKLVSKDSTNEYTISKILMEESLQAYRDKGLRVLIARPFNHSGPGQQPGFLLPDLGEQIADAATNHKPLLVGNLKTKRDYTDVRDVARAYALLATADNASLQYDVYNICSGKSIEGTKILALLKEAFGARDVQVEIDESRIRPNDVMDIYGSHERLSNDTGWQPQYSVEQMVNDYVTELQK